MIQKRKNRHNKTLKQFQRERRMKKQIRKQETNNEANKKNYLCNELNGSSTTNRLRDWIQNRNYPQIKLEQVKKVAGVLHLGGKVLVNGDKHTVRIWCM